MQDTIGSGRNPQVAHTGSIPGKLFAMVVGSFFSPSNIPLYIHSPEPAQKSSTVGALWSTKQRLLYYSWRQEIVIHVGASTWHASATVHTSMS